ncbi:MAG: hypothetical protein HYX61_01960 [Gammaproteobacteria bacterium]|jgi:hypothetical protein|nr:hypothetical protein [Gammaproteobacteria bacterium]
MSTRAAFGISAAVGFGLSLAFGAPLALAAVYGLLSGALGAAAYNAPPVRHGIAVVHSRPWFGGWFGHRAAVVAPHHGVRHGVRVLPTHAPVAHAAPSRGLFSSFPSFGFGGSASRTTPAPHGGSRTSFAPSVSTTHGGIGRGPVHHTRTMLRR